MHIACIYALQFVKNCCTVSNYIVTKKLDFSAISVRIILNDIMFLKLTLHVNFHLLHFSKYYYPLPIFYSLIVVY